MNLGCKQVNYYGKNANRNSLSKQNTETTNGFKIKSNMLYNIHMYLNKITSVNYCIYITYFFFQPLTEAKLK